ncbi:uncharacterized protein LOC119724827 [Patiria miniata]|uniref:Death domain-containing protein n=1 Tax=Patiria miniata TaxID=46514 RepID=A0A913ZLM4_PATMI|nr:uncharacterized protein LOC119724827 [Patiria miniata]
MANLTDDVARLQLKESMLDGPKGRYPPDGMEMKPTCMSQANSGCYSRTESLDVETDAVPSNEDVGQALDMRDQLGITQEMPEKSTEEDIPVKDKEMPDLITSSKEPDLRNDTKTAISPNRENPEQQQTKPSTVLPEGQLARVEDRNHTQCSDERMRANKTGDSHTDTGQAPVDDIDVAKVHISDHPAVPAAPCSRDIQDGTTASQPNSKPATSPKKRTMAPVFSSHQAPTAPHTSTPPQETNTLTSEHRSQVSHSVPPVSEDIGEVTTAAQPDSQSTIQGKLNMAAAASSSPLPYHQSARNMATSPHTPTQETIPWEEEHFDVLLLHSEHDTHHVEKFMEYAKRYSWKVTSPDEFPANLLKQIGFNSAFERSSFTVLLLSGNFLKDCWCEMRYQTALVQSIENPEKRFCVIPIKCQDHFKMPMELSVLTGVYLKAANCEKILKNTIRIERRIQREKMAASAHQGVSEVETAGLSLDELYNRKRPELNPGQSASHVFLSDETFRQICVRLDERNALGRDWRLVAEKMGFKASSIEALKVEKSPAAQILECFCQLKTVQGKSRKDILEILRKILSDIQRADVADILTHM